MKEFDELLEEFKSGNLYMLCSRPAVGKTTLALQLGLKFSAAYDKPVYIFSYEMSEEALRRKTLSLSADMSNKAPIYICECTHLTVEGMKDILKSKPQGGLVIIDYLQLIGFQGIATSREQAAENINKLKGLARERECAILCTAQLAKNSTLENPLGFNGETEYFGDDVILLYREKEDTATRKITVLKRRLDCTYTEKNTHEIKCDKKTVRFI